MNLRRTFLALGAMILGVGFFGASQAQAYTPKPPCVAFTSPGTSWPTNGHFFICDGTGPGTGLPPSAGALAARDAANATNSTLKAKFVANQVDVFVWFSPDGAGQHNSYPDFLYSSPVGGVRGFTVNTQGPYHIKPVVSIFARPTFGSAPFSSTDVFRATAHEIGHMMDIVNGRPSQASTFQNMLQTDFNDFDAYTGSINWSGLPPTCTGSNSAKLKCWFQYNVPPFSTNFNDLAREFFAEEYACSVTATIPPQAGTVLRSYFSTGQMPPNTRVRSRSYVKDMITAP